MGWMDLIKQALGFYRMQHVPIHFMLSFVCTVKPEFFKIKITSILIVCNSNTVGNLNTLFSLSSDYSTPSMFVFFIKGESIFKISL